jgi:hypothetical protein
MALTSHKVAGVYESIDDAREAAAALREEGFDDERVLLAHDEAWESDLTAFEDVERGARASLAGGAGAGAGIGAAGAGVLAAAGVNVIAAAPVLAVLAGAGLGAITGTAVANVSSGTVRELDFREMVRESLAQGHVVVLARARSEAEALRAQDVIARSAAKGAIDQGGGTAAP